MEATRTIDIEEFVDLAEIDPVYFERSYYLVPDGRAEKAYALLVETMSRTGKVAIGRFVLRTKQYLATLRARDGVLVLATMLFDDEVVAPDELEVPTATNTAPSEREINMATQLVESLSAPFDPAKYQDDYREKVLALIEAKAEGEIIQPAEAPAPAAPVVDLVAGSGSQPGRGPPALGVTPAVATGVVVDAARLRLELKGAQLGIPTGSPLVASAPAVPLGRAPDGSTTARGDQVRGHVVQVAPGADRQAGQEPGPERGRLQLRRHLYRAGAGVGQGLHEHPVGAHPAVDAEVADSEAGVALGGFEQVGTGMGHPLQDGSHHLRPARAAGQPEDGAPGAEVPLRSAEAEQGGHRNDSAGVVARCGDGFRLSGVAEQPQVLDQPVHGGAGGQHDGLDAPAEFAVALPGDDREAAARRPGSRSQDGRRR